MTGAKVGYVRVSTIDQNENRQLDGLELDKIFLDKKSGLAHQREGFRACFDYLREGDSLYIHSLDRLGRYLSDVLSIIESLASKCVTVYFVQERLTFAPDAENPVTKLQLHILGAVAEFERKRIKERQREGINAAKKRGTRFGRKPHFSDVEKKEIITRHHAGVSKAQLAREYGVSVLTVYRLFHAKVIKP